jgi:uncharacterized membrane-anchored protein
MRATLRKVPAITAIFWLIKVLTTAMGESTSDYLVHLFNPPLAVALGMIVLAAALALQLWVRRYIPWVYWLAVALVAIVGTMAADVLHIGLGIPYLISTIFFAVVLTVVFIVWNATEKSLSIHSITSLRREIFYWLTVTATFALGTAAGDMTASSLHLGYLTSGIVFVILILIPAVGYWRFHINAILAFWAAYILTRPLGASFADWVGKAPTHGGLGAGDGVVSLVLAAAIVSLVAYLSLTQRETTH